MGELKDAAENVQRAMRALDAHRHDGAPSLERDYRRALESYFVLAEKVLGHDVPVEDEEDDAFDVEARAAELVRGVTSIAGHYAAARTALRLARAYRDEPLTSGRRERECVQTAQRHRDAIHALRLRMQPAAEQLLLPGLAKTRPQAVGERRSVKSA